MPRPVINLVWFKRDLRRRDHAPLCEAIAAGRPTLLLFCLEPSLMAAPDADVRHWRFAHEAARDLRAQLVTCGHHLLICHREATGVLTILHRYADIDTLFSHQETGNKASFDRDRAVARWCREHGVAWREYGQDGVLRGRRHRRGWAEQLEAFLRAPLQHPDLSQLLSFPLSDDRRTALAGPPLPASVTRSDDRFQPGGETCARRYWNSFLTGRAENYGRHLSKPQLSRRSCSRLSPYLAWGNVSARELWQACEQHEPHSPLGRGLRNFQTRLWWRSHYLQKLESEWPIEFEPINRALAALDRREDEALFRAWAEGSTGYPMVDASMRCLAATGWVNFRMRAMLVTFATFTLWLPWRRAALHLARLFLDYEPGIHYPQVQMQAGLTGYHTLRIYNPTTQAERHDPDGAFIHAWLPELRGVPAPQCHRPWRLTALEQQLYGCRLGVDYPAPIVDFDSSTAAHRDRYWTLRTSEAVRAELTTVWERHCLPENVEQYRKEVKPEK